MKPEGVIVPKEVIQDERKILDRAIVRGVGIEKEIVPEGLEDEERAFDEGIVVREVKVIPDEFPGKSGSVNGDREQGEEACAQPVLRRKNSQALDEG